MHMTDLNSGTAPCRFDGNRDVRDECSLFPATTHLAPAKAPLLSLAQTRKIQVVWDPIDATRRFFELISYRPSTTMRFCWPAFAVAVVFLATPSVAETRRQESAIDVYALMSGKCSTLKIAGRDFACRAVAYFHSEQGRANYTVALVDPADDSHVISFSGDNGRREQDNLYELPVDRMLLNSRDRPKADGLPVPSVELSAGTCKQVGSFASRRISTVSCTATDKNGKKYELQFESDGSPIVLRTLKEIPLPSEKRRARQAEQSECRQRADDAKLLPRDRIPYMIGCLAQDSQTPAADEPK
jgi:hypothetical protein